MEDPLLVLLIFVAATLYSSVGHGGGTGYQAAMVLFSLTPAVIPPSSLVLNILVASIGSVRFYRAKCFSWPTFWPFAVASVPLAFLGGLYKLNDATFKTILAIGLLLAALRLAINLRPAKPRTIPLTAALGCGGVIGLVSGLTGIGGGVFLSPVLVLTGWAEVRIAAGVSVVFILVNSISGLIGQLTKGIELPHDLWYWAPAAVIGGVIGSEFGSRRLGNIVLRRLLALVLVIASVKLVSEIWSVPKAVSAGRSVPATVSVRAYREYNAWRRCVG